MAKLKNPLLSLAASGSVARVITFLRRRSQNIAEKTPVVPDQKTLAQLSWRHMFQKVVALWHALSASEKQDWESQARSRHMTGFAWFMSQALKPNPGLYLPLQGGKMQGDIDMDGHGIEDLATPTQPKDAATKAYADAPETTQTIGARIHNTALQTIAHATVTKVAFNAILYDTDNMVDLANDQIVCKTPGKYLVWTSIGWSASAVGAREVAIRIPAAAHLAFAILMASPVDQTIYQVTTIAPLTVGQNFQVEVWQTSGGNLNIPGSAGNRYDCEFAMQRIG